MSDKKQKELLYKILLLGDSSVGKTCFLMRYSDNTFQEIHMSTIGLDYKLKNVQLDDGKIVKIQIWDTAGQDRFRSITKNYYKGAHGIILIYDVTSRKTYENIKIEYIINSIHFFFLISHYSIYLLSHPIYYIFPQFF